MEKISGDGRRILWVHRVVLIKCKPLLIYHWKCCSFSTWDTNCCHFFAGTCCLLFTMFWVTETEQHVDVNSLLYDLSWLKLNFMCCTTRNFVTKKVYSLIVCLYFVIFIKDSILFLMLQINNIFFLYPVQCTCSLRIYYVFRILRTSNICENGWHWQRQHFFEPCTFCTVGMQWLWWW